MADPIHKLSWKIIGKRVIPGDIFGLDYIDVEWSHADGPFTDKKLVPVYSGRGVPVITYEEEVHGTRAVVKDNLTVKPGTPESTIAMMLDEKRPALARALGVDP